MINNSSLCVLGILTFIPILGHTQEFWADRAGGGPLEVLEKHAVGKIYESESMSNIIFQNSSGQYEVNSFGKSQVILPSEIVSIVSGDNSLSRDGRRATLAAENIELDGSNSVLLEPGSWIIEVEPVSGNSDSTFNEGYIDYENSRYSLIVTQFDQATPSGSSVTLSARIVDNLNGDQIVNSIDNVKMKATVYEGVKAYNNKNMKDDGVESRGDEIRGDGIYSTEIPVNKAGDFSLMVSFEGSIDGQFIELATSVNTFVSENRLKVDSKTIDATQGTVLGDQLEEARFGLPLELRSVKGSMPDIVDTYAELWAKDSNGSDIVVSWIGGLVEPSESGRKRWEIPFSFHSGWLEDNDYYPPFSLRNIEIKDIDVGDEILADDREIAVHGLSIVSSSNEKRTYKNPGNNLDRTRGVHPKYLGNVAYETSNRAGSRFGSDKIVLSLHGFCDGRKPLRNFSSTIRNKGYEYSGSTRGQSATRYAIEVMQHFGWRPGKVRGIVAHSHGGMAAASLLQNFSYFFVDNARSRPPNVVSMGTPYHGSGLVEGRLPGWIGSALIGVYQFITGCDIPNELYPSRNSSWNQSIKWRARNQMTAFFTTHTRPPNIFENRDCRDSLSAQIRGSDDGVLAPSNGLGFVDGGDYDLHYSGYCHMSGMGQKDQWTNPTFINFVNNLFHSTTEAYQPF